MTDSTMTELGEDVVEVLRSAVAVRGVAPGIAAVERLSGGASRLTWRVDLSSGEAVIVQRERAGSAGANLAMAQQAELLEAAADTGVPVPQVLGSGGEPGTGFVVLELVGGEAIPRRILRDPALLDAGAGLAFEAGRALAAVHRIAPSTARLAGGDALVQMTGLLHGFEEPHPALELGLQWLEEHRPAPGEQVVLHGDFRLGNLLVERSGISAVLDWELAHLGAAAEDLGWFCGRAWRFGSPLEAGGVGTVHDLLAGYRAGGGIAPDPAELRWWQAYGTLRWALICMLQASVHLNGYHRSVELAAIGRRTAECEEDLLELAFGASDFEPLEPPGPPATLHDAPSAQDLLAAVGEHLDALRQDLGGSQAFHLIVAGNVLSMVAREIALAPRQVVEHRARLERAGVHDDAVLAELIRGGMTGEQREAIVELVRQDVREKLAVSHPGYWLGDR